jgi:hypothetical protein
VIRIPARRNLLIVAFLSVWLCGWVAGEFTAPFQLFREIGRHSGAAAFMLFWLCGWTAGGGFVIYILLWQLRGFEVVTVSGAALSIRQSLPLFGRVKEYDLTQIRDLRVASYTYNPFDFKNRMAFWGIGGGNLAFDYGYKTFRFGAGVDEAEARIILQTILQRAPQLAEVSKI